MIGHVFLPFVDVQQIELHDEYASWLSDWLEDIAGDIEDCNIASSDCLQAMLTELALHGSFQHDWLEILESCLTDENGDPLAYSEAFGRRLWNYGAQWKQTPIHAIHTQWWAQTLINGNADAKLAILVESNIQNSGWIYNVELSPTQHATRMKSEYQMSMAMGVAILNQAQSLAQYANKLKSTLSSEPRSPFLSAEYFRIQALDTLDALHLLPAALNDVVKFCETGAGYCDFSMEEKRDDYMGTRKRSGHDEAVHSPLSALHALYIAYQLDAKTYRHVLSRVNGFASHIRQYPFDIPAFKIRDLTDIQFGTDITPLEILASAYIISNLGDNLDE